MGPMPQTKCGPPIRARNARAGSRVHRPVQLVAISGSLKESSANSALVRALADQAPERVEVWDELGALRHFTPDDDGGAPVASLRAAVTRADGVVIATPEYAGGMPGTLKNALDWLVGTGELYDKHVAVVSAAPSPERGQQARRWVEEVLGYQGARVVASFTVTAADDPGDVLARVVDAFDAHHH